MRNEIKSIILKDKVTHLVEYTFINNFVNFTDVYQTKIMSIRSGLYEFKKIDLHIHYWCLQFKRYNHSTTELI